MPRTPSRWPPSRGATSARTAFCSGSWCCVTALSRWPLFSLRVRRKLRLVWVLSLFVNVGMWLERFVIFAGSRATSSALCNGVSISQRHRDQYHRRQLRLVPDAVQPVHRFLPIVSMTELKEGCDGCGTRCVRNRRRRHERFDSDSCGFLHEEECVHAIETVRRAGFPHRGSRPSPARRSLRRSNSPRAQSACAYCWAASPEF